MILRTVGEIRAALNNLPAEMEIQFEPLSAAWLGSSALLRFGRINFYNKGGFRDAMPIDPDAIALVYIEEDDEEE